MSKMSTALHSVRRAAYQAGGSGDTRGARIRTLERMIRDAYAHNEQITGIEGIKERHIVHHLARLRDKSDGKRGIGKRRACVLVGDIRCALRAAGRTQAANSPTISNSALGIDGASRDGTKTAATPAQYQKARAVAIARDPGIAAMTALQDALGLRIQEAIQAGPSLADWARQIARDQRATIIHGTKNGRPRDAWPISKERALAAIAEAQAVAAQRGGHLLPGTLEQAKNRAGNEWSRHITPASGITSHQMRYAYARERVAQAQQEGLSYSEALARTAMELGHGDGRGRWLAQVYLR